MFYLLRAVYVLAVLPTSVLFMYVVLLYFHTNQTKNFGFMDIYCEMVTLFLIFWYAFPYTCIDPDKASHI